MPSPMSTLKRLIIPIIHSYETIAFLISQAKPLYRRACLSRMIGIVSGGDHSKEGGTSLKEADYSQPPLVLSIMLPLFMVDLLCFPLWVSVVFSTPVTMYCYYQGIYLCHFTPSPPFLATYLSHEHEAGSYYHSSSLSEIVDSSYKHSTKHAMHIITSFAIGQLNPFAKFLR